MSDPSTSLRVWAVHRCRRGTGADHAGGPGQRGADPALLRGLVAGWVSGGESVAERKTVTRQTMIGEGGIALISTRCLEMGFIFHPRRVDHGIDGHIDLIDPRSGALLNQVLLV